MKVIIPSSSLILTDYLPAGEGLICYNLIKHISLNSKENQYIVYSTESKIQNKLPENVKNIAFKKYNFFPATTDFYYFKNWKNYCDNVSKKISKIKNIDILHYMLPFNVNQNYTPIYKKPLIVGPIFYPWINLEEEDYGEKKIIKSDFFIKRKLKNYYLKKLKQNCKLQYKKTIEQADRIVITVDKIKEIIPEQYHHKLVKIPIGTDINKYYQNEIPKNNTILFLAYIVKRKGLEYLIKSVEFLIKEFKDLKLIIAGEGPDKKYFEKIVEEKQLQNNIDFIGHIEHTKTDEIFRKARIYVLPSYGEPFGMSIVEAMSSGLPVIVTERGGAPEVVGKHNNDFVVPIKNERILAKKIKLLLNDYRLCCELGNKNRKFAEQNYEWTGIAKKYIELYKEVNENEK